MVWILDIYINTWGKLHLHNEIFSIKPKSFFKTIDFLYVSHAVMCSMHMTWGYSLGVIPYVREFYGVEFSTAVS